MEKTIIYLGMRVITFKFAPEKAKAAIHWMVCKHDRLDLHAMMKACYFADKKHLNEHHRPIFGATYRAMRFGPVPLEIYEMAKGDPIWLPEIDADRYPWRLDGFRLSPRDNNEPDLEALSKSDRTALREGFEKSCNMSFDARTAATHGKDWQAAELGIMRYEDMIEDSPEKSEIVKYLRENARFMRL
jgi:hypothetical protein